MLDKYDQCLVAKLMSHGWNSKEISNIAELPINSVVLLSTRIKNNDDSIDDDVWYNYLTTSERRMVNLVEKSIDVIYGDDNGQS